MAGIIYPCIVIFNKTYMESIGLIVGIVSGFTILAIAAERFLKIVVFTNSSKTHIGTTRQLLSISVIMWLITSSVLLPISFYDYILHRVIFFTLGPLCIVVIMIGISILYFSIFIKIHSHDKRMSARLNRGGNYKYTKLVLRAYVVIVVVYAICWLPWAIESLRIMFTMYYGFEEEDRCIVSSLVFYIGVAMILLNSAVNPVIYWRRLPDFREGISELFGCCTNEKSCCFRQTVVIEDSSVQDTGNRSTNTTDELVLQMSNKTHDSRC
ncbi:adrenocorticotropic hormone receptor-like [Antedon mediterranea]|uniref:adrenocorticotropic hormone receptor-like n=1 Tax=Antedon mediterranea TaxID=105859 RepID=UPI003AF834B7